MKLLDLLKNEGIEFEVREGMDNTFINVKLEDGDEVEIITTLAGYIIHWNDSYWFNNDEWETLDCIQAF